MKSELYKRAYEEVNSRIDIIAKHLENAHLMGNLNSALYPLNFSHPFGGYDGNEAVRVEVRRGTNDTYALLRLVDYKRTFFIPHWKGHRRQVVDRIREFYLSDFQGLIRCLLAGNGVACNIGKPKVRFLIGARGSVAPVQLYLPNTDWEMMLQHYFDWVDEGRPRKFMLLKIAQDLLKYRDQRGDMPRVFYHFLTDVRIAAEGSASVHHFNDYLIITNYYDGNRYVGHHEYLLSSLAEEEYILEQYDKIHNLCLR